MGQFIKCSVKTCKYQEEQKCTLDEIKVGNSSEEALKKMRLHVKVLNVVKKK